jgi:hypothetical protein
MARFSFRLKGSAGVSGGRESTLIRFKLARLATQVAQSSLCCGVLALLIFSGRAVAQADLGHLELHLGYTHVTGDNGLDGFNGGAALRFNRRVSVGLDYDSAWDRTLPTAFITSSTGAISIHSHLSNFLIGPRIFFPSKKLTFKSEQFIPFGEFQIGGSHLSTKFERAGATEKSSEDAYSWLLGGGADWNFARHWSGRLNANLLRTHFASSGQSRFRLVLGVVYTFAGGGQ